MLRCAVLCAGLGLLVSLLGATPGLAVPVQRWDNGAPLGDYEIAPGASLVGVGLAYADLPDAQLRGAVLLGAHFNSARLIGADLEGVSAVGAFFDGAWLNCVSAMGVSFEGASLAGAVLAAGDFDGSAFAGADLSGALAIETSPVPLHEPRGSPPDEGRSQR